MRKRLTPPYCRHSIMKSRNVPLENNTRIQNNRESKVNSGQIDRLGASSVSSSVFMTSVILCSVDWYLSTFRTTHWPHNKGSSRPRRLGQLQETVHSTLFLPFAHVVKF